jgi:hypothetical protein
MAGSDTQRKPGLLSRPLIQRIVGFAVIAALASIFIFQNTATVRIRLLIRDHAPVGCVADRVGPRPAGDQVTVRRRH